NHRGMRRLAECLCTLGKALKRGRAERRQKTRHPPPAQLLNRAIHVPWRGQRAIKVHAAEAVDLKIEKAGKFNVHQYIPARSSLGFLPGLQRCEAVRAVGFCRGAASK